MVHSDQGIQFSGAEWQSCPKANYMVGSKSWRDNRYGNAVAESFFQLIKRKRINRQIYPTSRIGKLRCIQLGRDAFTTRGADLAWHEL